MEINKKFLAIVSLFITIFLFATIVLVGSLMNQKREEYIDNQFDRLYEDFKSMQTLFLMADSYDNEMACLAFETKLKDLDTYVWKLGEKIDKYRSASEEFQKDKYYLTQKVIFNENEVFYLLLMRSMINKCNLSKEVIMFFYQNSADCKKCDDQSFILADINTLDDDKGNQEVAVFSFDMDLNVSELNLLAKYYKVDQYPCVVIGEEPYCGIQDKNFIIEKICNNYPDMMICELHSAEK